MAKFYESFAGQLGGLVDHAVREGMRRGFVRRDRGQSKEPRPDAGRLVVEAATFYGGQSEADLYRAPPRADRVVEAKRSSLADGGEVVDAAWMSGYDPRWTRVHDEYASFDRNQRVHVRHYRHVAPKRTIVCVHGYGGGGYLFEEQAFAVRWWYERGFDVLLFTLPWHGLRADNRAPGWPSLDVGWTNESFLHAIWDLRQAIAWVRARGAEDVTLVGMSLGGYVVSLIATVSKAEVDHVFPIIPVASFPDLLWHLGENTAQKERATRDGITRERAQDAMAVHTPLLRKPLVAAERMLVVGARGDRLVPPEHGERIAKHFGCEYISFEGGHVLQLGRGRALERMAERLGVKR